MADRPVRPAFRLETVLGALSAPLRPRIVRDFSGSWKSSLLPRMREADVTHQHQYGQERRSHVRVADLNARFPGLMDLVAAWTPPKAD
ncbi:MULTISPECIES: hypothetical protein [unclassified Streptomyces]|uniref:hypothetical protein n=1 Tax=unclassified Streptomyces TaxID=2593676 RepID=UPI0004C6E35A|nr:MULTISPECIES: hypothetical protein [unclassified Streptomyces]